MHQYFVVVQKQQVGPFSINEIQGKIISGDLVEKSLCWTEGMTDWCPLGTINEFASLFPGGLLHAKTKRNSKAALFSMFLGGITFVAWIIGIPIVAHAFQHGHYEMVSDLPILVKGFMILLPVCFVINVIGFICGLFGLLPRFAKRHQGLIGIALNMGPLWAGCLYELLKAN